MPADKLPGRTNRPARTPESPGLVRLTITDLGSGGEGVGRAGGLVVFVPGALPGDRVTARLVPAGHGSRFARGELVTVDDPSPHRVAPPCPVARSCGGCQLLAFSYPAQLEWKTRVVREALRRVGHLEEVAVHPCLAASHPLGYRNKAQFPVSRGRWTARGGSGRKSGRAFRDRAAAGGSQADRAELVAGLFRRGTHEVVPVESCPLQHPINNRVLAAAVRLASELGVPAYDEDTGEGLLRHILARVADGGREAMAVFVTADSTFPAGRRLAAALREAVPEVKTVVQNVNTRRTNVILGPRDIVLSGRGFITDHLGGLAFRVSASSFFQVNPEQAEVLYGVATRLARGARRAADVYCGVGTITLFLAANLEGLEQIVGVEVNPAAARDAAANARANRIDKATFVCGDAAAVVRDMAEARLSLDTVVLDPPRKGCEPAVIEALLRLGPARVVYVSCNPATLARDLARLAAGGYRVTEAQPVDMFPQTVHVETVALAEREGAPRTGRKGTMAGERKR